MDEWKKTKRRVAQVIGSEAREALRRLEHQVLREAVAREDIVRQMHSEPQSHIVSYRRSCLIEKFQQQRIAQNLEYQEAQLRVQLQTEEVTMTSLAKGKFAGNLRRSEASCHQHPTVGDCSST